MVLPRESIFAFDSSSDLNNSINESEKGGSIYANSDNGGGSSKGKNTRISKWKKRRLAKKKKRAQEKPRTQEEKQVWYSKLILYSVFLLSAVAVCVMTYFFTKREQEDDFELAFQSVAQAVIGSTNRNALTIRQSYEAFSLAITSMTIASTSNWPNVTIPNFEAQGLKLLYGTDGQSSSGISNETTSTTTKGPVFLAPLVSEAERVGWEQYSVEHQGWLQDSLDFIGDEEQAPLIVEYIWKQRTPINLLVPPEPEDRPPRPYYAPIWQVSPASPAETAVGQLINRNAYDLDVLVRVLDEILVKQIPLLTPIVGSTSPSTDNIGPSPESVLVVPVYDSSLPSDNPTLVALVGGLLEWTQDLLQNLLPQGIDGIVVVLKNHGCSGINSEGEEINYSFAIDGPSVTYLGPTDMHDRNYDDLVIIQDLDTIATVGNDNGDSCSYTQYIYPSQGFQDAYTSRLPLIYTMTVLSIFAAAAVIFMLYDWTVERRNETLEARAARTDALVNSLFPANVRDRLMHERNDSANNNLGDSREEETTTGGNRDSTATGNNNNGHNTQSRDGGFDNLVTDSSGVFTTKPIADLFPDATVMFADMVGFTAWSSTREPSQVFTLLETLYNAFDRLARRRRVFKVETIGDCYVAAAGLPEYRADHAMVMARFSHDCMIKMKDVVQSLEVALGPDTAELCMRFGLHSGPVTAGVLRGEKSRFQLFGDTVNTAARIESSGEKNKIHISQETAELLIEHGKSHWVQKRETLVIAKGKGEMQTFWLVPTGGMRQETSSVVSRSSMEEKTNMDDRPIEQITKKVMNNKMQRLIGWNVDVLKRQLRQVLAMRDPSTIYPSIATILLDEEGGEVTKSVGGDANTDSTDNSSQNSSQRSTSTFEPPNIEVLEIHCERGATVLDEVQEIITLPSEPAHHNVDPFSIEFSPEVINQLEDYVTAIARMYRDNPFHSFEHASHVTMSVCKLMSRVVTPDSIDYTNMSVKKQVGDEELHKYTYGITSDPITQFACALSALIHDVDHTGVPNAQLVKENSDIANHYKNKSVAEQNSVDLAWELLMEPQYAELRSCIYSTKEELDRFRQLLVNAVMATDIADRELGALRKNRWEKAFNNDEEASSSMTTILEDRNRKATIVIEHLIQASDVSHTMQHWHIYLKWNERLFQEMYKAYKEGRADSDPSESWYQGEIGFFDFYLIPLAKKLKECGVFGVASDEYLNYVKANRKEWEAKGKAVVESYLEHYRLEIGDETEGTKTNQ